MLLEPQARVRTLNTTFPQTFLLYLAPIFLIFILFFWAQCLQSLFIFPSFSLPIPHVWAQCLRASTALAGDTNSVPNAHIGWLTTTYEYSTSSCSDALFWPPRALMHICSEHTHAHTHRVSFPDNWYLLHGDVFTDHFHTSLCHCFASGYSACWGQKGNTRAGSHFPASRSETKSAKHLGS